MQADCGSQVSNAIFGSSEENGTAGSGGGGFFGSSAPTENGHGGGSSAQARSRGPMSSYVSQAKLAGVCEVLKPNVECAR